MSFKSIQCSDCRNLIGFYDDFGISFQVIVGSFVCVKCKRNHKSLGINDIAPNALNKMAGQENTW